MRATVTHLVYKPRWEMGKKSDAKRRAKLKERRKKVEAHFARAVSSQTKVTEWIAAHDAEPNIIAELVDEGGTLLAYVEGDNEDNWTVVVGGVPVAGASDTLIALGMFLAAAVDDRASGNESYIQFSQWLIEEVEAQCEVKNLDWGGFLRSLLPIEKQLLPLPPQRVL